MDKTREALGNFMSKAGHHDTTVQETVAPAVKHETVKPTRHEEIQTAIDKEVHQDHYHQTVQPVQDREVLPEQHKHHVAGVERREYDERDRQRTEQALQAERAKLRDERHVAETQTTQSRAPVVEGEHVHHHVHETIQPVIQKEVVQPEVIHTTIPIKEVHHTATQHHGTTSLPAVTMDEFKRKGGALGGQQERHDHFEGCPQGVHSEGCGHNQGQGYESHTGRAHGVHGANTSTRGAQSQRTAGTGMNERTVPGTAMKTSTSAEPEHHTGSPKKASLLDRLNPMKDSDGDGKKGFMK